MLRPAFPALLSLPALLAFLAAAPPAAAEAPFPLGNLSDTLAPWRPGQVGISLGGVSESRFDRARLSGPAVAPAAPTGENQAYSRADVLLSARPGPASGARALFRVHQDWSRYYEEGPNPLVLRWLDYSGTLRGGALAYSLGDFRAAFSPLTLAAPAPEILHEPAIFAARRRRAMGEWFLEDGRVPLQGAHLRYAETPQDWLGVHAEAFAARLRRADPDGAAAWRFQGDDADRWSAAATARFALLRGLEAGATHLQVADPVALGRARGAAGPYEANAVTAPRAALDAAPLFGDRPFRLRLEAEYAFSAYRSERDTGADTARALLRSLSLDGRALEARLRAGYGRPDGPFTLDLDAAWLRVDAGYVNDLAQSPAFQGRRILNSKNPVGGRSRGYSTLDALYNHAYDIRPVTSLNSLEGWGAGSGRAYEGANNWLRSAAFKNSYASWLTTRAERQALAAGLDPHVQLLYPYGRATPNRAGLDASLTATALRGALKVTVLAARLKEIATDTTPAAPAAPAAFARDGLGLAADLSPWLPRPASVTFGWTRDSRGAFGTTFLSAGAKAGALPWLDLLAGYQAIATTGTPEGGLTPGLTQSHWALGLAARPGPRTEFTLEGGILDLAEAGAPAAGFRQAQASAALTLSF